MVFSLVREMLQCNLSICVTHSAVLGLTYYGFCFRFYVQQSQHTCGQNWCSCMTNTKNMTTPSSPSWPTPQRPGVKASSRTSSPRSVFAWQSFWTGWRRLNKYEGFWGQPHKLTVFTVVFDQGDVYWLRSSMHLCAKVTVNSNLLLFLEFVTMSVFTCAENVHVSRPSREKKNPFGGNWTNKKRKKIQFWKNCFYRMLVTHASGNDTQLLLLPVNHLVHILQAPYQCH